MHIQNRTTNLFESFVAAWALVHLDIYFRVFLLNMVQQVFLEIEGFWTTQAPMVWGGQLHFLKELNSIRFQQIVLLLLTFGESIRQQ